MKISEKRGAITLFKLELFNHLITSQAKFRKYNFMSPEEFTKNCFNFFDSSSLLEHTFIEKTAKVYEMIERRRSPAHTEGLCNYGRQENF